MLEFLAWPEHLIGGVRRAAAAPSIALPPHLGQLRSSVPRRCRCGRPVSTVADGLCDGADTPFRPLREINGDKRKHQQDTPAQAATGKTPSPPRQTMTYKTIIAASAVLPLFLGAANSSSGNGSRPSDPSVSAARIASELVGPYFVPRVSPASYRSFAALGRPVPTAARSTCRCSSSA